MSKDNDRITSLIQELQSLHVRATEVVREIEEARAQQHTREDARGEHHKYSTGDRIYVKNSIRRPVFAASTWSGFKERRGTVTGVDKGKVYFTTDNGTKTWRATKNICPLGTRE